VKIHFSDVLNCLFSYKRFVRRITSYIYIKVVVTDTYLLIILRSKVEIGQMSKMTEHMTKHMKHIEENVVFWYFIEQI